MNHTLIIAESQDLKSTGTENGSDTGKHTEKLVC